MRRRRCDKHKDMLTEGKCPRCELEKVRKENEELVEALSRYGDPVRVLIMYAPGQRLLGAVLRIMSIPSSLGAWSRFDEPLEETVIGASDRSSASSFIVPKSVAEKVAALADDIQEEHDSMYKRAFDEGINRVRQGVGVIIDRIESLHLKAVLTSGEKAAELAESYHRTRAFEEAIRKAIDSSSDIDDLWGESDDEGRNPEAQG